MKPFIIQGKKEQLFDKFRKWKVEEKKVNKFEYFNSLLRPNLMFYCWYPPFFWTSRRAGGQLELFKFRSNNIFGVFCCEKEEFDVVKFSLLYWTCNTINWVCHSSHNQNCNLPDKLSPKMVL